MPDCFLTIAERSEPGTNLTHALYLSPAFSAGRRRKNRVAICKNLDSSNLNIFNLDRDSS
jgi:hypothetical protein